ncbi:30S ribosomal protein S4 [Candidatus Woesearchaeota archaeon]|nr:MAG: 30S ribosomal protein S4 [Candidatus Woesearchaeota archaeon]
MGDPRKQRKKYNTPRHPWEAERIKEERELMKEYGLKNKKEVWKMNSMLKHIKKQTKDLISRRGTPKAEEDEKMFLAKLAKLNLINAGAKIEDVLDLHIKDVLERRLQTQMIRKGLAKTIKQARQFIVHGHVMVNGKKIDVPSYIVSSKEENTIEFSPKSALADEEHPERSNKQVVQEEAKDKEGGEE